MNRDRLLADAKARALALVEGYKPPEPAEISPARPGGRAALELAVDGFAQQGKATPHDRGRRRGAGRGAVRRRRPTSPSRRPRTTLLQARARRPSCAWCRHRRPWPASSTCSTPASRCGTRRRMRGATPCPPSYRGASPQRDMPPSSCYEHASCSRALGREPDSCRATRRPRPTLVDRARGGGQVLRERAAAAQPRRRRGGLQLRERRRCARRRASRRPTTPSSRAAGPGSRPIRTMAARACPRLCKSWSRR